MSVGRYMIDDPHCWDDFTDDVKSKLVAGGVNTVNICAAVIRKNSIETAKQNFTMRNDFSTRQIQYDACPKDVKDINSIQTEVGATAKAPWMARQENGGMHTTDGKALKIPNRNARGGSNARPVIKTNYFKKGSGKMISYEMNDKTHGTGKSALVSAAYKAARDKTWLYYKRTVFAVTGFSAENGKASFTLTPLYNLKFTETKTEAKPWLKPNTDKTLADMDKIFCQQMDKVYAKL